MMKIKKRTQKFTYPILQGFLLSFILISIGVTGVSLVVTYFLADEIYDYQDTVDGVHLPEVDAIVCLAGGRGRIAAAGDLWYRYLELSKKNVLPFLKVPILYFSGTGPKMTGNLLLKQFRSGVAPLIQLDQVIIEKKSSNTDENARWLAYYAKQHQWKKILLLTSSYHMKRARFIFDQVLKSQGNPIEIETLSVYQEPFASEEWRADSNSIRVTVLEYFKWVYYQSLWKKRHYLFRSDSL